MKKVFLVFAIAGSLVACNNAADTTGEKKDSIDSVANATKDMVDSTASQTKDAIDSTAEAKKDMIDSNAKRVDSINHK